MSNTATAAADQPFRDCGRRLHALHHGLHQLSAAARAVDAPPLEEQPWFQLLERKLLPQVGIEPSLVAAVVGGTNIGKSVVFNQLAGFHASSSSKHASHTKHPVCLLRDGNEGATKLAALFPTFQIADWEHAEQALQEDERNLLFVKTTPAAPPNLLLLDTPDIDSHAQINWQRADAIRQAADVLFAVLTSQKYNDAAVKRFFRDAVTEDKYVVVIFNLCSLPQDDQDIPGWLATFEHETGIRAKRVYVAPRDKAAAAELTLPFFEYDRTTSKRSPDIHSLRLVFSELQFPQIRMQTLASAFSQLQHAHDGLPGYLEQLRVASTAYRQAMEAVAARQHETKQAWPTLPASLLIREVRAWWSGQRKGWSKQVHGFYNRVNQVVLAPIAMIQSWRSSTPPEPEIEQYRQREWEQVSFAFDSVIASLTTVADRGPLVLRPVFNELLQSLELETSRQTLLHEHQQVDLQAELQRVVTRELKTFSDENPASVRMLEQIDSAAAAARPAVSVVLMMTGVGLPFGEAAMHLTSTAMMQGLFHVAGDAVGGAAVAVGGETAVAQGASFGAGFLQAWFLRLQEAFVRERTDWLAAALERLLLQRVRTRLQAASTLDQSPEFADVHQQWQELELAIAAARRAADAGKECE